MNGNTQCYVSDVPPVGNAGVLTSSPSEAFRAMERCLVSMDMAMPTTHVTKYDPGYSDVNTFVSNAGGTKVRLDYIFHTHDIHTFDASVFVNECIATSVDPKDHIPLQATVSLPVMNGTACVKRRVVNYSDSSIDDKHKQAVFRCELENLEHISVDVENSSHCHILDEMLLEKLNDAFPADKKACKQQFISSSTFKLIQKYL